MITKLYHCSSGVELIFATNLPAKMIAMVIGFKIYRRYVHETARV